MIGPFPFQRLFEVIDVLVDPRVGIIHHVVETRRQAGAPNLFSYYAMACNTAAFSGQKNYPDGAGVSTQRDLALAKAIGEAVERYCAAIYDVEELPLYSYEQAPFPCIAPEMFALYGSCQYDDPSFPYRPFNRQTPVRWAQAVDILTGESRYVPAPMVYVPYVYQQNEAPIIQPISTGLACHSSYADACISAICEVIERDAFTITWQAKLPPPQLLIESLSESNKDLVDRFTQTGVAIALFNITLDHGVPTILAVLKSRRLDAPALVVSAASHLNPEVAVRKSLEELELSRRLAELLKTQMIPIDAAPDYENIVSQHCHLRLFAEGANSHLADFLFRSEERVEFAELADFSQRRPDLDLEILVQTVTRVGHQLLCSDLTTPDVEELGLSVVRIIIPGFHPLFFGHRCRALGGTRLWRVPQALGYEGITASYGDNSAPHPFP